MGLLADVASRDGGGDIVDFCLDCGGREGIRHGSLELCDLRCAGSRHAAVGHEQRHAITRREDRIDSRIDVSSTHRDASSGGFRLVRHFVRATR